MIVYIKENSFVARLAAWKLSCSRMAVTFGSTIYLYNIKRSHFLEDTSWVCHELAHVYQYKRYGFLSFLYIYLKEYIRKGYYNNKLEQEARMAESDASLIRGITFR